MYEKNEEAGNLNTSLDPDLENVNQYKFTKLFANHFKYLIFFTLFLKALLCLYSMCRILNNLGNYWT